ncbi:glycine zipper 2TM domain-containing protein [Mesorhizobium sp. PAMC28654]|uniref:glycine zipper domain-containing protein n=1 Tax=Mesorhizobium sp. PAMC28654 TaxID=2880934 RepID=UPI001D0B2064|nr:YMGG-like glycine zipper-containing protein [Mesorhizobium sp. PAMC28654]UDL89498.1 glycine zipper 2TM domain-containing protein [Mesorhizobium sp. PAMC28654]
MIMKKTIVAVLMTVATVALAGCETQSESQQRATTGALIGGAGGALVGQALGGNTASTVVGAAGGALLGAVIGQSTTPQPSGQQLCRYQNRSGQIYTAPCDDRYYRGQY